LAYSPAGIILEPTKTKSASRFAKSGQAAVIMARVLKKDRTAKNANSRSKASVTSGQGNKAGRKPKASTDQWRTKTLMSRPGFLIRRLYQIHVSIFVEECAAETITPVQYSILANLHRSGPIDQATLSRAVALDRTSVADIVGRLERRRLLTRRVSPRDRRMMLSELTHQGRALLQRLEAASACAHDRTISSLPDKETVFFLEALRRLIDSRQD
jgi:MarR family transcriptional regulator, lower aerobic nicotinate degradation pathway regulator